MAAASAKPHSPALLCSVALHAILLAWILYPPVRVVTPQQQVIDISVVMPSSPEPQPAAVAKAEPLPETARPVASVRRQAEKTLSRVEKPAAPSSPAIPTSGPSAPDATQTLAADTKPVYNAVSLHNAPPAYPESARYKGMEGEVMLEVDVTAEGAAQEVVVAHSSGYVILDKAAREAITRWHFLPATRGGEIVQAKIEIPIEFRLD